MTVAMTEPFEDDEDGAGAEAFAQATRVVEALLFASVTPLPAEELARSIPSGIEIGQVLARLTTLYAPRGVNLRQDDAFAPLYLRRRSARPPVLPLASRDAS